MSDETGTRFSVLRCVSGCYAEVHISWESSEMESNSPHTVHNFLLDGRLNDVPLYDNLFINLIRDFYPL